MKMNIFLSRQKGSALVMVIIAFVVISILATAALTLAQSNTTQVVAQTNGILSYYIARSGAEATYEALRVSSSYAQFATGNTVVTANITFDEGTADISIQGFDEGSTRRVRVTSSGTASGTTISRKSVLEFDYNGYGNIKWSR